MTLTTSEATQTALNEIGNGMRLRVPISGPYIDGRFVGQQGELVEGLGSLDVDNPYRKGGELYRVPIPLPVDVVQELLELARSGVLKEMTEFRVSQRAGWRECAIDGEGAHIFAMTQ